MRTWFYFLQTLGKFTFTSVLLFLFNFFLFASRGKRQDGLLRLKLMAMSTSYFHFFLRHVVGRMSGFLVLPQIFFNTHIKFSSKVYSRPLEVSSDSSPSVLLPSCRLVGLSRVISRREALRSTEETVIDSGGRLYLSIITAPWRSRSWNCVCPARPLSCMDGWIGVSFIFVSDCRNDVQE